MQLPSPSVVIARVAAALEHDVLPYVEEHYRVVQLEATVTLLRNLAGRVEWRQDDLTADIEATDRALAALQSALGDAAPAPSDDVGEASFDRLRARRDQLAIALEAIYRPANGVDDTVRSDLIAALTPMLRESITREDARNERGRTA